MNSIFLVVSVCSFLSGFAAGLSSFGAAICFQIGWVFFFKFPVSFPLDMPVVHSPSENMQLAGILIAIQNGCFFVGLFCFYVRQDKMKLVIKEIILVLWPGVSLAIVAGNYLLLSIHSSWLDTILGLTFYLTAMERLSVLIRRGNKSDEYVVKKRIVILALGCLASIASGILTGLYGIPGLPLILFFSFLNLEKEKMQVNMIVHLVSVLPVRVIALIAFDQIGFGKFYPLFFLVLVIGIPCATAGFWVSKYISSVHIQMFLLFLIIGASALLLHLEGNTLLNRLLLAIFCSGFVLLFLFAIFVWQRQSKQTEKEKEETRQQEAQENSLL